MKVLLTGAAGSVGHHVLDQLLKEKHTVTVIEMKTARAENILKPYYKKVILKWGSITERNLVNELVKGQNIVIHLAGLIPPAAGVNPELTKNINYFGTKNIVDAIKNYNPDCFLMFSSSISVYGDRVDKYLINVTDQFKISEGDYYAKIKLETEALIKNSGINYTIFRLSAIMDVPAIDPLMFHMPPDTKLEIASGRDTARAFVNGINFKEDLNKNTYNLGGGVLCRTTYREFLKGCFKVFGLDYKHLDETAFATQNFHCGYYEDGDVLNEIVDFQTDTLDTYYDYLGTHVSKLQKKMAGLFSYFILDKLNRSSEPRMAMKKENKGLISRFFKK